MSGQPARPTKWLLCAVFLLYVVLLLAVAWCHEPWFDEAQAWLLARDAGVGELLFERLRYEGTPGLWHLVLMVPAKLGMPPRTMTVLSAVLASATVYLFLRYSPFPWYVKVLFPFGFFTFYQYAVVARSYTLMALLLVSIAAVFPTRNERPILFFALLALLANTSLHGFIMAGFLAVYHLWRLWPKAVGRLTAKLGGSRQGEAVPQREIWGFGDLESRSPPSKSLGPSIPKSPASASRWGFAALSATRHPPPGTRRPRAGSLLRRHLVGAVVLGGIGLMVVVQLIPPADLGFPAHQMDPGRSLLLLDALTLNRPLSLVVLVLSAVWFWRQRLFLLWAMPTLGLLALCVFAWASVWHEGVLYYYWVFCLWLSFQRVASDHPATPSLALSSSASLPPAAGVATGSQDDKDSARPVTRFRFCCARSGRPSLLRGSALPTPGPRWLKPAVELAFVVVLGWHLHWSIVCSFHDAAQAYSGSRAASSYLLAHQLQEEVIYAHGFSTISVLPYFPRNVFDNYNQKRNPSYLVWSQTNPLLQTRKSLLADAPQYVLVGIKRRGDDGLDDPDYELVKRFEGHVFWKHGVLEPDVFLLYRRRSGRSAGSRLAAAR